MSARIFICACALCAVYLGGCASARSARPQVSRLTNEQLLGIASVLERNGDTVRAEQYLQQALRQDADTALVIRRLLRLYVTDGQYRLAIDQAENYLRRHPRDRSVRLLLGTLYDALSLTTKAVEQYARVLAEAPDDAQAHFALASALHQGGRERARADEHFRAYLKIEPDGPHSEEARSLLLTELP